MAKLFVSGCSFSDYTCVDVTWGEALSDLLGMGYVHMNRGGGSNDRSWREIVRMTLSGEITSDDLVILQYTNIDRREFGATESGYVADNISKEQFDTARGVFYTTAYKCDSFVWQNSNWDKKLHEAYQHTGALSLPYNLTHFDTQHSMFDSFCKEHGVNIIYMQTRYMENDIVELRGQYIFPEFLHMPLNQEDDPEHLLLGEIEHDPGVFDNSHLSEAGHRVLANLVYTYIQEQGVLKNEQTT